MVGYYQQSAVDAFCGGTMFLDAFTARRNEAIAYPGTFKATAAIVGCKPLAVIADTGFDTYAIFEHNTG